MSSEDLYPVGTILLTNDSIVKPANGIEWN